jgi:uncharacterized protein (DUF342 family)
MLAPNTTPQDAAGAFAILQVIADPEKAKKRLKELTELAGHANQTMQDARDKLAEAEKLRKSLDGREAQVTSKEAAIAKRESDLAKGKAVLDEFAAELKAQEGRFLALQAATESTLKAREDAVSDRERVVKTAEAATARALLAAETTKAELDRKLELLRA